MSSQSGEGVRGRGGERSARRAKEGMEWDQTNPRPLATARLPLGGLPADPTYCEWGALVGGRIRRLRRRRRMTLTDFGRALTRPDGSHFSAGWVSRLERGRSAAALYVYLA